jgi:hypothetical protein
MLHSNKNEKAPRSPRKNKTLKRNITQPVLEHEAEAEMEQQKAMGTQQKTKPNKTGSAYKDTSAKHSTSRSAKTAK